MKILGMIGMVAGLLMAGAESENFTAMLILCTGGVLLFAGSAWLLTRGIDGDNDGR